MRIEINEKGSPEFYREVANVSMQYRRLRKKPERKLQDFYREVKVYLSVAAAVGIFEIVIQVWLGFDAIGIALLGILAFLMLFTGKYYISMKKYLNTMLNDTRTSTLIIEKEYIQIEIGSDQAIRLGWENVAFARVFPESICFMSKEAPAIVIAVDRLHMDAVVEYIRANGIDIRIYE